jgi:hypothetical protein
MNAVLKVITEKKCFFYHSEFLVFQRDTAATVDVRTTILSRRLAATPLNSAERITAERRLAEAVQVNCFSSFVILCTLGFSSSNENRSQKQLTRSLKNHLQSIVLITLN